MAMLEVKDLQVYYGMIQAIKGISFEVNQGETIALIGANGAGKTTTLHAVTGLTPVKSGSIFSSKEKISRKYLLTRSYLWEWHTSRKDDAYLQNSVFIRT